MSMVPHHQSIDIHWSLSGLRQIMGQEIGHVVGDSQWAKPLPGSFQTWAALTEVSVAFPRVAVWQGPWLLMSDPPLLASYADNYGVRPEADQQVLREMAWFWRSLGWGHYSTPVCYAIQSFLMLDVWPTDFWRTVSRLPAHPVRDWLRLERRVLLLRTAIEAAAAGHGSVRWGQGSIDCRPLLTTSR